MSCDNYIMIGRYWIVEEAPFVHVLHYEKVSHKGKNVNNFVICDIL
jgi:hypothetical protein